MKRFIFGLFLALLLVAPSVSFAAPFVKSDIRSPSLIRRVATLVELEATPGSVVINTVYVSGRLASGDGYEGEFHWIATGDLTAGDTAAIAVDTLKGVYAPATGGYWKRDYSEEVNAWWFTLVGDNVQDDAAAIQAGNDYVRLTGELLRVSPTTTGYKLSSKLYITANFNATGATFNMPGTLPIAIEVSDGLGSNAVLSLKRITLPVLQNSTKPGTGWAGQGIGYMLRNLDASEILIQGAVDFAVGVQCAGESAGFSYNKITIGRIVNNEVNLRLQPIDAPGWVNQNKFLVGRGGYFEGNGIASIQLLPFGFGSGILYNAPNYNEFDTTSIEGGDPDHHLVIAGIGNKFNNVRFEEDATNPKIQFVGDTVVDGLCKENVIEGGYHVGDAVFTNAGGSLDSLSRQHLDKFGPFSTTALTQGIYTNNVSGGDAVHYTGFPATKDTLNATDADTDWTWRISEDFIEKKATADAAPRVRIGVEGIRVGNGTTAINLQPIIAPFFGSPEGPGGLVAPLGSLVLSTNGGAGTSIYTKETEVVPGVPDDIGWVGK